MNNITKAILLPLSAVLITACGSDSDTTVDIPTNPAPAPAPEPTTIYDVAAGSGDFTTLTAAVDAAGLADALDDPDATLTVFAPTDAAFALLGQETIDALLADTDTLTDILSYHVLSTEVDSAGAMAAAGMTVDALNGDPLALSLDGDSLLINTATVTMTDIEADNGVIHVIDAVLMPPMEMDMPTMNIVETAVAAGSFETLVAALQATGLDAALADESAEFTVFAPTDAAFSLIAPDTIGALLADTDALSGILLQHVVAGKVDSTTAYTLNGMQATTLSEAMVDININKMTDTLHFGGAQIVTKDIYTTNGVIHVIDAVVLESATLPAVTDTIAGIATANDSFSTLLAALQVAGLDGVLADPDATFTVFAPTDEAFAQLGADTIEALLADPDMLADILLYHVVAGAAVLSDTAIGVTRDEMAETAKITMANEDMAALSFVNGKLMVNKSAISATNVLASNGVIHVIDQVMLPPAEMAMSDMNIVETAIANPAFSTLVTAVTAAGLVDTLADPDAMFTVFAPTNDAFAKIDADALNALLADTDALTNVLLQHVVSAKVSSLDAYAANGMYAETAAGNKLGIELVNYAMTMDSDMYSVAYNKESMRLIGGMGGSQPGFTLYVFDADLGTDGSVCEGTCAENWPPVMADMEMIKNIPGLSLITRNDGSMQAAFRGRPLYYFIGDAMPGDANGQGLNDVWWQVNQEQVSLQIEGSEVTMTDIYTSNGVIHVIDTVITDVSDK